MANRTPKSSHLNKGFALFMQVYYACSRLATAIHSLVKDSRVFFYLWDNYQPGLLYDQTDKKDVEVKALRKSAGTDRSPVNQPPAQGFCRYLSGILRQGSMWDRLVYMTDFMTAL